KQPYAIARADGAPRAIGEFAKAGVGRGTRSSAPSSSSIEPNANMRPRRNRMPLEIDRKDWPVWLGEVEADPARPGPPPDGTREFAASRRSECPLPVQRAPDGSCRRRHHETFLRPSFLHVRPSLLVVRRVLAVVFH